MRLIILLLLTLPLLARAEIHSEAITWKVDDVEFSGYLVYAKGGEARPGVVMVPNWMGVTDSALSKAKSIAADGYVVLVADVYGSSVRPANAQEAGAAAGKAYADRALLRKRVTAAADLLKTQPASVPLQHDSIAAIGFCFGGATVLELARSGYELDAVVSFHGNLTTPHHQFAGADLGSQGQIAGAERCRRQLREVRRHRRLRAGNARSWRGLAIRQFCRCRALFCRSRRATAARLRLQRTRRQTRVSDDERTPE